MAMSKGPRPPNKNEVKKKEDEEVTEASEESFPASDPPAFNPPGRSDEEMERMKRSGKDDGNPPDRDRSTSRKEG